MFDFDGMNWSESQKLTAGDGAAQDYFGYSVSLSGDRALIGAYGNDGTGDRSGSAYVFNYNGENWSENQKLTDDNGSAFNHFGISVSLSGNGALIGSNSGPAYLYEFHGLNWNLATAISVNDGFVGNRFAESVSLSGNRALIGAHLDNVRGNKSGSAYVIISDDLIYLNGFE